MIELLAPEVLTVESPSSGQRIEGTGICHNGPIDDSPKANATRPTTTRKLQQRSS